MKYYIYSDPYPSKYPIKEQLKQEIIAKLKNTVTDPAQAELFIVLGGDGTMVRAIQALKKYNKPFFGVNCGTLGFLLNNIDSIDQIPQSLDGLEQITEPFLEADITTTKGESINTLAVNDILINHDVSLNPTFEIIDSDQEQNQIQGSGLIVSSAIGSTGYRASFRGPLIATGNNNIGLMGIGTGKFNKTTMKKHTPYTIVIDSPRDPIEVRIDGRYNIIKDAKKVKYYTSDQEFTLLFEKVLFNQKRLELHSSKLERTI